MQVQSAIAAQGDRMQWVEGRLGAARTIARHLASYPASYASAQTGWIANVLDLNDSTLTLDSATLSDTARISLAEGSRISRLTRRMQRSRT